MSNVVIFVELWKASQIKYQLKSEYGLFGEIVIYQEDQTSQIYACTSQHHRLHRSCISSLQAIVVDLQRCSLARTTGCRYGKRECKTTFHDRLFVEAFVSFNWEYLSVDLFVEVQTSISQRKHRYPQPISSVSAGRANIHVTQVVIIIMHRFT